MAIEFDVALKEPADLGRIVARTQSYFADAVDAITEIKCIHTPESAAFKINERAMVSVTSEGTFDDNNLPGEHFWYCVNASELRTAESYLLALIVLQAFLECYSDGSAIDESNLLGLGRLFGLNEVHSLAKRIAHKKGLSKTADMFIEVSNFSSP